MTGRSGFWSYVHADDRDDGGRVVALSRLLARRLRLLTGEDHSIFLDKERLSWGDDWTRRISEELLGSSVFIPIITPSYFRSQSCRDELSSFAGAANALGLEELILPLYYVTVPEFEEPGPSGDDLVDLVRRYQWEDWRAVGLEGHASALHRKAVHRLATQFLERVSEADAKPTEESTGRSGARLIHGQPHAVKATPGDSQEDEDNEDGLLEILAAGEEAMQRLAGRIELVGPILEEIGTRAQDATTEIARNDANGGGFSGRLSASRRLAKSLEKPASEIESVSVGFLEDLLLIHPMVMAIMEIARNDDSQRAAAEEFIQTIVDLSLSAEDGLGSASSFADSVASASHWSKDIRPVFRRIERAVRQMADARRIFRSWLASAATIPGFEQVAEMSQEPDDPSAGLVG